MDIHDLAWLAGFLEGEGFFSCQVRAGYGRIMIGVTSTDRDVVERLARLVPRSRIYGPYTPEPDGLAKRPQYRWRFGIKPLVADLVTSLRPLMCERRQAQIDAMLELYATYPGPEPALAAPHGTARRFRGGCRCEPCWAANRRYKRDGAKRRRAELAAG
jgi:hypothetical protein